MAGFPTRPSRTAFGPEMENENPVRNPARELDADKINLAWWQTAGAGLTSPKVHIRCTVNPGTTTVTNAYQALAFDPDAAVSAISFVYEQAGRYSFAFASQYANEDGTLTNLALDSGICLPCNVVYASGTHTGANNVATLTDGTKAWSVNELVDKWIYNLDDGSKAVITANTADTVTASLAGGSENDWDTGESYIIIAPVYSGMVHLSSGYEGTCMFFDVDRTLTDPDAFILLLW